MDRQDRDAVCVVADANGMTVETAVTCFVTGVANKETELLDELGLFIRNTCEGVATRALHRLACNLKGA